MLKAKLYTILGGIGLFLLGLVKVLWGRVQKQKKRADRAEAELEFKDDVDEMETELDSNYQPHRAEIVNADKDEPFDVLTDPDSVRVRDKST